MDALYLTRDGRYDRAAILAGANVNYALNRKRADAFSDDIERKLALDAAWTRARAEKQRYDSRHRPERFREVSRETARELSTDGRIA